MKKIDFQILGIGAWGPGFHNWPELKAMLLGQTESEQTFDEAAIKILAKGPKPEIIPSNERRRAPLPVRLAVETSWQATQNADIDPVELPCVFVSGIGDTQLTDYMCRALAGEQRALSPTKFHNSVHNAAAGYWTISTGCMQPATSIAGFQESVSLTLMEALLQCQTDQKPILLSFYDAPSSEVLRELLLNKYPFSASIIIAPAGFSPAAATFTASVEPAPANWSEFGSTAVLEDCYAVNPSAKILALLKNIAMSTGADTHDMSHSVLMPLSSECHLRISQGSRV